MPSTHVRSHLALILAMALWGSSFVALKVGVTLLPPMQVIFLRMVVGSAGFLLLWPWLRRGFHYQRGDWYWLGLMALCEPCLYFLLEANGLRYTSAGQAGMVTAMLPLMVAIAAWFVLAEKTSLRQWLGFGIAVAGVITMTLAGGPAGQAPNPLLGNFLQWLAMVCAVGYTLLVKRLVLHYPAILLTALQCFIGAVFFLPFALLSPIPGTIDPLALIIVLYLGLVITLGTYGLYNYSLGQLPAAVAAGYTNLLPVFALLFSVWLLDERPNPLQWLAIGVIFLGVLLSQYRVRSPELPVPSVSG